MKKATILSIDDDENLQTVVQTYLESDGYQVLKAVNVKELDQRLSGGVYDVILLDLVFPETDGFSLIGRIRAISQAPIIIVSGKSDTTEKIVGLEMGADDYITKPFEMRELSARIKAVLRRIQTPVENSATPTPANDHASAQVKFNGWRLDRTQYQLFDAKNQPANLTTGEFQLLEALVTAPHRTLSREHLFSLTREGSFDVYDRAIDIQVARIRKKLGDDPKTPGLIKTVRGIGYMFTGEIEKQS